MSTRNVSLQQSCLKKDIDLWQKRADEHKEKQLINPFSTWTGASHRAVLDKNDPHYGRPVEGSLTEYRGKRAGQHISAEILELCNVIKEIGCQGTDKSYHIPFAQLFEAYTRISNKLVGMLLRARKQGLVSFEGEMLYQRRDDQVLITLLPDFSA